MARAGKAIEALKEISEGVDEQIKSAVAGLRRHDLNRFQAARTKLQEAIALLLEVES
ncbi:hypothetical protein LCGC14_2195670 [marine sediment metagenome]|uniref:Uncharacterized protein n=1 Tax=marine sediment metagenome TaxID=412755 RepID=A0A0F9GE13_9ZZZZ